MLGEVADEVDIAFEKVMAAQGDVPDEVSDKAVSGTVFIPFHFAEAAANALTNTALDPVAKIPEFKVCAVKVEAL